MASMDLMTKNSLCPDVPKQSLCKTKVIGTSKGKTFIIEALRITAPVGYFP